MQIDPWYTEGGPPPLTKEEGDFFDEQRKLLRSHVGAFMKAHDDSPAVDWSTHHINVPVQKLADVLFILHDRLLPRFNYLERMFKYFTTGEGREN